MNRQQRRASARAGASRAPTLSNGARGQLRALIAAALARGVDPGDIVGDVRELAGGGEEVRLHSRRVVVDGLAEFSGAETRALAARIRALPVSAGIPVGVIGVDGGALVTTVRLFILAPGGDA